MDRWQSVKKVWIQDLTPRRVLFQIHRWLGVTAAAYVAVVTLTGAALVFRIDLQRTLAPHLFYPKVDGPQADLGAVVESLERAYPNHRVSGIDAPTIDRPVVLAYLTQGRQFLTVLVDPVDAQTLGVLPERSFMRLLQDLHFDLLGGRTGRAVNGMGAVCLLVMCVTGLVIWWPGAASWRRAMTIDVARGWKRLVFDVHSATGIWTVVVTAMWAVTGISFTFPSQFRSAVNALSPLTLTSSPRSDRSAADRQPRPALRDVITTARQRMGGRPIARIVMPATEQAPFQLLFAERAPTPPWAELQSIYLDQYTGAVLQEPSSAPRSAGDRLMAWVGPLHVGSFGGPVVKLLWLMFGLAPGVLAVTGVVMWWNRITR